MTFSKLKRCTGFAITDATGRKKVLYENDDLMLGSFPNSYRVQYLNGEWVVNCKIVHDGVLLDDTTVGMFTFFEFVNSFGLGVKIKTV